MAGTYEDAVCPYGKGTANPPCAFARSNSNRLSYCITIDMRGFAEAFKRRFGRNSRNFMKLSPQDAERCWAIHNGD